MVLAPGFGTGASTRVIPESGAEPAASSGPVADLEAAGRSRRRPGATA